MPEHGIAISNPNHTVSAPVEALQPSTFGVVTEASLRLAQWGWQDSERSAWEIAERLASTYFPTSTSGYRRNGDRLSRIPRKGLDLIRATDELECGGLQWFCDMPRTDNPYEFETVRLKAALARLAAH